MPSSAVEDFDNILFEGRTRPSQQQPVSLAEPALRLEGEAIAADDIKEIFSLRGKFQVAAKKHQVPEEVLEGVASRESRVGKGLPKSGYGGKNDKMFGIMQINSEVHVLEGDYAPDSPEHINQAAGILKEYKVVMDKRFPNWSEDRRWQAAIAGYNAGPANIKNENLDAYTDGHDYSEDVMTRARIFRERMRQRSKRK